MHIYQAHVNIIIMSTNRLSILIAVFCFLLPVLHGEPLLDETPLIFQMSGVTTYTPDQGGTQKQGYKLTIGYSGTSWLGVQFSATGMTDVLVIKKNDFASSTPKTHQVTIEDYFTNSSGLFLDKNTQNDISAVSSTVTKHFSIEMIRFLGNNGGQDWNSPSQRYSFQEICFYTSSKTFDSTLFRNASKACYGFEIDNLVSTFKGLKLKTFTVNGYATLIYGWIGGPYVTGNVYFYHLVPLFTYSQKPALALQLGSIMKQKDGKSEGQDFNVYSPIQAETGDYYGTSITSIKPDKKNGGFNNNGLSAKFWNVDPAAQITQFGSTAIGIAFSRDIYSYDELDRELRSTFIFCLYLYAPGSITGSLSSKNCEAVELTRMYAVQPLKWASGVQIALQLVLLGLFVVILL